MKRLLVLAFALCALPAFGATCVVTEHALLPRDRNGQLMQIPTFPPLTTPQAVTYTTSTASSAFQGTTRYIGFICTAKAHFEVAASPSATANDPWVPADTWLFIQVPPGYEIAFYDGSS